MDFVFTLHKVPEGAFENDSIYNARKWDTMRVEEKRLVEQTYHLLSPPTVRIIEAVKKASIGPSLYKLKYDEDSMLFVRLSDGKIMDNVINEVPFTERNYGTVDGNGAALVLDRLVLYKPKKKYQEDYKPHPALFIAAKKPDLKVKMRKGKVLTVGEKVNEKLNPPASADALLKRNVVNEGGEYHDPIHGLVSSTQELGLNNGEKKQNYELTNGPVNTGHNNANLPERNEIFSEFEIPQPAVELEIAGESLVSVRVFDNQTRMMENGQNGQHSGNYEENRESTYEPNYGYQNSCGEGEEGDKSYESPPKHSE